MKQFMPIVLGAVLLMVACSQQSQEAPMHTSTSGLATVSATQSAMAASELASVLFADADFQGSKQELSVGTYNTGQLFVNDQLTSLRVAPGFRVTLYANKDFGGASRIYTQDCPNVGSDFNECRKPTCARTSTYQGNRSKVRNAGHGDWRCQASRY